MTYHKQIKQTGASIIVALFVVALVAAASVAMIIRLQIDTRRTELILNDITLSAAADGSIDWAIDTLINNAKKAQPSQLIDKLPLPSPINSVNGAKIGSTIYDAQGYFNLNNLSDTSYQTILIRLLQVISPKTQLTLLKNSVLAAAEWIAPGSNASANDQYYTKQNPSYLSAHQLFVSASEFRLIKGVNAKLFAAVSPFLIALPDITQININNAPLPVLMSLSQTMTLDAAKTIDKQRQVKPFASVNEFLTFDVVKNNNVTASTITVASNYFLVETQVQLGDQQITFYTLLKRGSKNSQPFVSIIWQSRGTL